MSNKIIISNFILYCKNWQKAVDFYSKKIGLEINFKNDWFVEFILNDSSRLSVADESRASVKSNFGNGTTLSFKIDDLNTQREFLINRGVETPEIKVHSWGATVLYIYDPEGNRIEFWEEK
ncbi:MAG TPA: VOC family protein [Victivallales bacterium]|nr:VOC family protein [Victivallales bacterium]